LTGERQESSGRALLYDTGTLPQSMPDRAIEKVKMFARNMLVCAQKLAKPTESFTLSFSSAGL
jgi:hypothetical protein